MTTKNISIKNNAGLYTLALRLVVGWTYFSAFWRRVALTNKLDMDGVGYIGEKFNHFLPNALGIKPLIQYMVENPDILWISMVAFTIIEGIVGLFIMMGWFSRAMSIAVFGLAMGMLLGAGWIGTTCLDEWQIGVLGIAAGFTLFLTGSGKYSLDNYFMKKNYKLTHHKLFPWIASGVLPIKESVLAKVVLIGSIFILGMTLMTNQVFHGGVWGTLHNKSVRPKLEITEGVIDKNTLSFDVYRVEGADVYGSWLIGIELVDANNNVVLDYTQDDLAALNDESISNYYIAKIEPHKHSLLIPLGAKARLHLKSDVLSSLDKGTYTLKMTDISGAFWEHKIEK